jgi:hypothetical protein
MPEKEPIQPRGSRYYQYYNYILSIFFQDVECSIKYRSPLTPPSCLTTALSQRYFLSARSNVGFSAEFS